MDRNEIVEMLKEVGGPNIQIVHHTGWVNLCCILAPWTHVGGRDASPSAGISIKDGGTSIFHCLGCKEKGTIPWLLRELEKYTGDSYKSLINNIEDGEFIGGSLPEWGSRLIDRTPERFLSNDYIELYDSAVGHWYLQQRGILRSTTKSMGLLIDPGDSQGDERILFPIYDRQNRLQGITGRAVLDVEPKVRDYHGLQKERALLGLHLVDVADPYVLVVEGLFDMAITYQYGYSSVATMHAGLTDFQAEKLVALGKPIVIMQDNDEAGVKGTKEIITKLDGKLPLSKVKYPKRGDRLGKKTCPKDPATCTMEEIDVMVKEAMIV